MPADIDAARWDRPNTRSRLCFGIRRAIRQGSDTVLRRPLMGRR